MDKVTSALRPYQIRPCAERPVVSLAREGSVLRQALTRIVRIEQVLPALYVLDAHLAEQHVQFVSRHVQFLAYLRYGEARYGIEHMVGILGTRLELCNLFVTSLQGRLHDLERTSHDYLVALVGTGHHVASVLADGGQDFAGDPSSELPCILYLASQHQGIECAFVDKYRSGSIDGERIVHRLVFLVHMVPERFLRILIS